MNAQRAPALALRSACKCGGQPRHSDLGRGANQGSGAWCKLCKHMISDRIAQLRFQSISPGFACLAGNEAK